MIIPVFKGVKEMDSQDFRTFQAAFSNSKGPEALYL